MSQAGTVGGFPRLRGASDTIRAPINPLDKSTVVSIFPRIIDERKYTIEPGRFVVPAGTYENPAILIVGSSSWFRKFEDEAQAIEIPHYSTHIAASIVTDYVNGMLEFNPDRMPGLFFIPGCKFDAQMKPSIPATLEWIKKEHKSLLDEANRKQRSWFLALVQLADASWANTNGNPRSIDDNMRMAAEHLQLKEKPWMQDFTSMEMKNCPACGTLLNPMFPICAACKTIIDAKKYAELGLKQAG